MISKFRRSFILVTMCMCGRGVCRGVAWGLQIGTDDNIDENSPWKKETIVSVCFRYKTKSNDFCFVLVSFSSVTSDTIAAVSLQ